MSVGRHVLKKINERYFIDRDPRLFRYILAFLRTRKLDLPDDQAERNMILREFDYFCISPTNPCSSYFYSAPLLFLLAEDFLTKEWKCTQTFGGHDDIVMCLRVIGKDRLLSGSKDKTMRLWNIATGKCIQKFEGIPYQGYIIISYYI